MEKMKNERELSRLHNSLRLRNYFIKLYSDKAETFIFGSIIGSCIGMKAKETEEEKNDRIPLK